MNAWLHQSFNVMTLLLLQMLLMMLFIENDLPESVLCSTVNRALMSPVLAVTYICNRGFDRVIEM